MTPLQYGPGLERLEAARGSKRACVGLTLPRTLSINSAFHSLYPMAGKKRALGGC